MFDGGLDQCLAALAGASQQKTRKTRKTRKTTTRQPATRTDRPTATAPGKVRNPLMFRKLEEEIFAVEERVETLREDMTRPENYNDHRNMLRLKAEETALLQQLEAAYQRWENWS